MRQLADLALLVNGVLAGFFLLDALRLWARGREVSPNLRVRVLLSLGITLMGMGQRFPEGLQTVAVNCGLAGIGCVIVGLLNVPAAYEQMRHCPAGGAVVAGEQVGRDAVYGAEERRRVADEAGAQSIVSGGVTK